MGLIKFSVSLAPLDVSNNVNNKRHLKFEYLVYQIILYLAKELLTIYTQYQYEHEVSTFSILHL